MLWGTWLSVCLHGGHWPYMCKLAVPHHQSRGVHQPLPLQCWWKLVNLQWVCGMFPLETDHLKVSFLSTTSTHCIQSLAVLYSLVSAFSTSVASVLWEWKLLTLSTGFRTHSMAPITPVAAPACTRLCRLFTLLTF